jgi:hypothetical protein
VTRIRAERPYNTEFKLEAVLEGHLKGAQPIDGHLGTL